MTTSVTKTRALCVATRCTSVDQFVATFHRFCGDDQSFFVATLTSRPIGLETAFSIQLADKQPVLRGMCVVLDAWDTPDNRYKRPGIRLGIKRLTDDSQSVFDRLRAAAAKAPTAVGEGTPSPGPPPLPAPMSPPPMPPGAMSPPLPPLLARSGPPPARAGTQIPPDALRPPAGPIRRAEAEAPAPSMDARPIETRPI